MLLAVLSGFFLAFIAPWVHQLLQERAGWALAMLPAGLSVYFARFLPQIMEGESLVFDYAWVPSLDISLTMHVDGLSLLFALLISIIGTFVVIYGGGYLKGDRDIAKFYVFILAFMASMLGLVLSDNLLGIFVFWELTSVTSFMLIGYYHDNEKYRKSAHQSMMVTIAGGLVMMAGLITLAIIASDAGLTGGDAYSLRAIMALDAGVVTSHALYVPTLLMILVGCFSKSAQFPFHFWLPNAMAGPTPVSAYLHSATMVKAGIYLMARLQPTMGGTALWMTLISVVGAVTMFIGIYMALKATDFKQVLAYSTIMALGVLTMLVGIGTQYAMVAFVSYLLAHAMYKGALFMVAGIVDHETGTKDLAVLSGLRRKMPITAFAAGLAALSLGGLPPLFGFVGKELMFEAVLGAEYMVPLLVTLSVLTGIFGIAVAAVIGLGPFWGELGETPKEVHEAPISMLLGPVVLAVLSLVFGVMPFLIDDLLVQAAVPVIYGESFDFHLALWHGINAPLLLSALSLGVGAVVYWKWDSVRAAMGRLQSLYDHGPEWLYNQFMDRTLPWIARATFTTLQSGYLRIYIMTIVLVPVVLVFYVFLTQWETGFDLTIHARFYHVLAAVTMFGGALYAAVARSRLGAVASAGVVGFMVALFYIFFSAPDLGITQVLVETLVVLMLVLVLYRLPRFNHYSSTGAHVRDAIIAASVGLMMTLSLLASFGEKYFEESISAGHLDVSYSMAHGTNVVNVILVDFRGFDTLGEATVISLVGIGVWAMLKFRAKDEES